MSDFKVTWRRTVYAAPMPSQHRLVLLALGEYADWKTHNDAHPGIRRLGDEVNCDRSTVKRALARGEELGLIHQEYRGHRTGDGRGLSSVYALRLPDSQWLSDAPLRTEPEVSMAQQRALENLNGSKTDSQWLSDAPPPTPTPTPTSIDPKDLGTEGPAVLARLEAGPVPSPSGSSSLGSSSPGPSLSEAVETSTLSPSGSSSQGSTDAQETDEFWCRNCKAHVTIPKGATRYESHLKECWA